MIKPKTLKGYLKIMIEVADIDPDILKGYDKLSRKEQLTLWDTITGIQNDLGGQMELILKKFDLKWNG